MGPHILTQLEGICKKLNYFFEIIFTEVDFRVIFLLFMASVRSRLPRPTLGPEVLTPTFRACVRADEVQLLHHPAPGDEGPLPKLDDVDQP